MQKTRPYPNLFAKFSGPFAEEEPERQRTQERTVVWAKFPHFPHWPALTIPSDQISTQLADTRHQKAAVPVRFFHTGRVAWILPTLIERDYLGFRQQHHGKTRNLTANRIAQLLNAVRLADEYLAGARIGKWGDTM